MATKKTKNTENSPKKLDDVTQFALEKALEIGYGRILNPDGTPIKVRQKEGYLGTKQFEVIGESNEPEAQPGEADRVFVEDANGKFIVDFPLSIRPIGYMRSQSEGGTVRSVQTEKPLAGDTISLLLQMLTRLNQIIEYGRNHGVTTELSYRIASKVFEGRWLWRNFSDDVTVSVTAITINKETGKRIERKINSVEEFAKEIEEALFSPESKFHKRNFRVSGTVQAEHGAEIFPSQQMIIDKKSVDEGHSKLLVVDSDGNALMTPQKIGNAIRTYDTWTTGIAIPVSATSGSLRRSEKGALRLITRSSDIAVSSTPTPDDYFTIANLIHGGLFTLKKSTKGAKTESVDPDTGEIKEA
jgi:hypothetical protein